MTEEAKTRRVVQAALEWTKGTSIAPDVYEGWLLEKYCEGKISLDVMVELVGERVKGSLASVMEASAIAPATEEDSRSWSR